MRTKLVLSAFLMVYALGLIGCEVSVNQSAEQKKPEITVLLSLDKSTYTRGESIRALVEIKNVGSEDVLINRRMAINSYGAPDIVRDITFVITGPGSGQAPFIARVNVRPVNSLDFIALSPGESIGSSYDIEEMYRMEESGSYVILAIYQNTFDSHSDSAWKGELESNPVGFQIMP